MLIKGFWHFRIEVCYNHKKKNQKNKYEKIVRKMDNNNKNNILYLYENIYIYRNSDGRREQFTFVCYIFNFYKYLNGSLNQLHYIILDIHSTLYIFLKEIISFDI